METTELTEPELTAVKIAYLCRMLLGNAPMVDGYGVMSDMVDRIGMFADSITTVVPIEMVDKISNLNQDILSQLKKIL